MIYILVSFRVCSFPHQITMHITREVVITFTCPGQILLVEKIALDSSYPTYWTRHQFASLKKYTRTPTRVSLITLNAILSVHMNHPVLCETVTFVTAIETSDPIFLYTNYIQVIFVLSCIYQVSPLWLECVPFHGIYWASSQFPRSLIQQPLHVMLFLFVTNKYLFDATALMCGRSGQVSLSISTLS